MRRVGWQCAPARLRLAGTRPVREQERSALARRSIRLANTLVPNPSRLRLLVVSCLLALVPLQWTILRLSGQEPWPALYLPGFPTGDAHAAPVIWVPDLVVATSSGNEVALDPDVLLEDFPTSSSAALEVWFRSGLTADGRPKPCDRDRPDDPSGFFETRCPGRSRDGENALATSDTRAFLHSRLSTVVPDPVALLITWSQTRLESSGRPATRLPGRVRVVVPLR